VDNGWFYKVLEFVVRQLCSKASFVRMCAFGVVIMDVEHAANVRLASTSMHQGATVEDPGAYSHAVGFMHQSCLTWSLS
jgi:hypothetical protein